MSNEESLSDALSHKAAVVGNCLVSFTPQISPQDKQDIQDCLLYAELAASEKYDLGKLPKKWIDHYQGRLLKAGFGLRSVISSEPRKISTPWELQRYSFAITREAGSSRLAQLLCESYEALQLNSFARAFFNEQISTDKAGVFQVAPCEQTSAGEVILFLCGMHYTSTTTLRDFLFWTESDYEMVVQAVGGAFTFNRDLFAENRLGVHRKIDGYQRRFILKLQP